MQFDPIKIQDYMKTNDPSLMGQQIITDNKSQEASNSKAPEALRAISIDNSNYNKQGKNDFEEGLKSEIAKQENMGDSLQKTADYVESPLSGETVAQMESDGFSSMDSEASTIVTVVDKIKMALAKGGKDVSSMGGLDNSIIEAMSTNMSAAVSMQKELADTISDDGINYLITNELEPTIENIYNAQYKAPVNVSSSKMSDEQAASLVDSMSSQINSVIESAGLEINEESIALCEDMLKNGLPLTADNLTYYNELKDYIKPDDEAIDTAIEDIIAEGKEPTNAYLIKGYSMMDQAREIYDEIFNMDEVSLQDVTARRQLEEIRLSMTVEANFTMISKGMAIDTSNLTDLVNKLRELEQSLIEDLVKATTPELTKANANTYIETINTVSSMKDLPAALLGHIPDISAVTMRQVSEEYSISFEASITVSSSVVEKMERTYDAVGTEVRKDLGDNINKAFRNVSDLLAEIGMEDSAVNQRAVRILGYNQMEVTTENVNTIKTADETVNRLFKNMTPAVVSEMIKRGQNPLNMTISEINEAAEEIKLETGSTSSDESFAKFLWKAEHNNEITEEQRTSFIGIYRMINTIEKTDGAAVGALINAGTEINLKNLLTAVRSSKHTGRDIKIDDDFGAIDQINVKDLSITQQIQVAYSVNCLRDAKEAMTPSKLASYDDENEILIMSPEQFAEAMESQEDAASEREYNEYLKQQLQESYKSLNEVEDIIRQYDLPTSAVNINAMNSLLSSRNSLFKDVLEKKAVDEESPIDQIIDGLIEDFGESCKTPHEMAEAQERLGDMAENAMDNVLESEDVTSIDLRTMKLIKTEISSVNKLAREDETYHIPIMVADEMGNMTLKIVEGKENKGLVDVVLSTEKTGTVRASFRYEAGSLEGSFECDNADEYRKISTSLFALTAAIESEAGINVSLRSRQNLNLDVNDVYKNSDVEREVNPDTVLTSTLYSVARSFIKNISSIL